MSERVATLGADGRDWSEVAHTLPASWRVTTLSDLSLVSGRYGSSEPAEPFSPYLPRYVRITDIDVLGGLRTDKRASLADDKAAGYLLSQGDLVFARSGSTVGKTYLYDPHDGRCAHGGYLIRFRLNSAQCVPEYVAHYTRSPSYWAWVRRTQRQAAQPNINAEELRRLAIPLPPIAQQRRIAEILTMGERTIRTSARILTASIALKRALVAELMSRGANRRGRPLQPGQTRELNLADLPSGWSIEPVANLLAKRRDAMRSGPFGSQLKKSDLCAQGVPLLGIDNVHVDRFTRPYRRFVSPQTFDRLIRFQVFPGDVMITIMGTVGRSCVVPRYVDRALSSKHVWTLTFDEKRYLGFLASLQFNHAPWVRAHFRRDEQGGTMNAIRSDTLRTVRLPVPPMAEQRRIAAILQRSEQRIEAERMILAQHQMLQRGLMNELFSGRTRVG